MRLIHCFVFLLMTLPAIVQCHPSSAVATLSLFSVFSTEQGRRARLGAEYLEKSVSECALLFNCSWTEVEKKRTFPVLSAQFVSTHAAVLKTSQGLTALAGDACDLWWR